MLLFCFYVCNHAIRILHAAFTPTQAYTLFADRLANDDIQQFTIPIQENKLGIFVSHINEEFHLFYHCDHCIYHCNWMPGSTTEFYKIRILNGLKKWHKNYFDNKTLTFSTTKTEEMWAWAES